MKTISYVLLFPGLQETSHVYLNFALIAYMSHCVLKHQKKQINLFSVPVNKFKQIHLDSIPHCDISSLWV